ncbi:uncharacterized protein LOC130901618 [Diorhabda carinulata]|uniref:uncharacterized protein LOC130901618 n=1 Tax=Diorhabda carinulata TaxID=1163345 RepID=UPI0025A0AE7F|nr:uncharacterized protein LOC130901618 [Diorhabda carinulata]
MEIVKRVIKSNHYSETIYCYKTEVVSENSSLLGFKDSLPVLSKPIYNNINMASAPGKRTVRVETNSNTGEKFIMLNGKKIKILAESEIPKNSQITKLASLQNLNNSNCPVKIKILKGISKKNEEYQNSLTNHTNIYPINIDKKVTSQITGKIPLNENKFKIIPISSVENIVANTTDKTTVDSLRMLKNDNVTNKPIIVNTTLLNNLINSTSNIQSAALDLTKNCDMQETTRTAVVSKDKCLQADIKPIMVTKEVQTDDDLELDLDYLLRMDIFDLPSIINDIETQSPISAGKMINSNIVDDGTTKKYTTLNNVVSKKNNENSFLPSSKSSKNCAENFFKELRNALIFDEQGNLPIHVAVLTNDIKFVKRSIFILKLLKQSMDIPNNKDYSPLQLAIINDSPVNIIGALLTNGASVHLTDSEGNNVIHYAVEFERAEALKWLLSYIGPETNCIDEYNHEGLTPLMICCLNGYHDCAEILLESEANPNVKDQISGRTALFHASERQDVDMVEMLLQFNACTKTKNFFGTSPHDAMYEIEDMPEQIKFMILGKNKRKTVDDPRPSKYKKTELNKAGLKTYARLEKIQFKPNVKTFSVVK